MKNIIFFLVIHGYVEINSTFIDMKTCISCNQEKELDEFWNKKQRKDGKSPYCIPCNKERNKPYLNNAAAKARTNKYHKTERGRETARKRSQKWRSENYEKAIQSQRKASRKRIKNGKQAEAELKRLRTDIQYRVSSRLRSRIWGALKGHVKADSTFTLIGCTPNQLKAHLESQFTEGMSWDNYGDWHIDHIRPCASFDLSDENQQKKCFNYKNLQPLWAIDNIRKGCNI